MLCGRLGEVVRGGVGVVVVLVAGDAESSGAAEVVGDVVCECGFVFGVRLQDTGLGDVVPCVDREVVG